MTDRSTWKRLEQRVCAKFGGNRTPLSGSNSQHGTSADCIKTRFPDFYIEVKLRALFSHHRIFKEAAREAAREDKMPILVTHVKAETSELVVLRIEDFIEMAELAQDRRITTKGDHPVHGGDEEWDVGE